MTDTDPILVLVDQEDAQTVFSILEGVKGWRLLEKGGLNTPRPGQLTVSDLRVILEDADPFALVALVSTIGNTARLRVAKATGPVFKFQVDNTAEAAAEVLANDRAIRRVVEAVLAYVASDPPRPEWIELQAAVAALNTLNP